MAQARPQAPALGELRHELLPDLPLADLEFLKNKDTVAAIIRVLDELEQQRQLTPQRDDKRFRKKLLQSLNEANLLPILKRFSFIKEKNNYYLIHDGEKQNALLGKGGSGKVKYGINLLTEELVAVKILTIYRDHTAVHIKRDGEDESKRLAKVDQLLAAFPSISVNKGFQFHLIQKLARSYKLHLFNETQAGLYERLHVFLMLCKNLNELHNRGLVHGDISGNNVIYNPEDASVKLVDFGKSCELISPESGYKQTPWHISMKGNAAPETLEPKGIFSRSSDVFNTGRVMAYTFNLLDDKKELVDKLTYDGKSSLLSFNIKYSLYLLIQAMIAPKANQRMSFTDVMLQVERLKQHATLEPDLLGNVGIINIEKIISDPSSSQTLINNLKKLKITRVILIDPCNDHLNENHIALKQILEQHKIVVTRKVFFEKVAPQILERIIAAHVKSTGMISYYFHLDSQKIDLIDDDITDQLHHFNDKVARLYTKVVALKQQKKLRNEVQLQALKNDVNLLTEECNALRALAKTLGQTDILLEKMSLTLSHMCKPAKVRYEEQRKKTNAQLKFNPHMPPQDFFIYSTDSYYATVYYNINGNYNKVEGISTNDILSFFTNPKIISRYRGPVRPLPETYSIIPPHFRFQDIHRIPPADIDSSEELIKAAVAGNTDVVVQYITKHCKTLDSANKVSHPINCALLHAADQGHYAIVALLMLTLGVDVNFKGDDGSTALIFAASNRHINIVNLLLSHHADVNIINNDGVNALIAAAHHGDDKTVKALVTAGCELNHIDKENCTALIHAALGDHVKVVVELLKAPKLNLNLKGEGSRTAFEYATIKKNREIIYLLSNAATPQYSPSPAKTDHVIQPGNLDTFNISNASVYERLQVALKLCKTVDELHRQGTVHGNLSVFNILYCPEDGTIKLTAFDKSSKIPTPESGFRQTPTTKDMTNREDAPEVVEPRGIYSTQSDIFNIGRVLGYTFKLLGLNYQLLTLHSNDYKKVQHFIADYSLRTAIHLLVKQMLSPVASRRPSLKAIMRELEKLIRRVSVDAASRENVAIINVENYILDRDKKSSYQKLIHYLKTANIKRVILIDPTGDGIDAEHIALIKLLEQQKIIVDKNLHSKQAKKKVIQEIIANHYKTMGMVFNYSYYDFDTSQLIKTDMADKHNAYNNKLAKLYSQVMNLKHRRKLLFKSQSLTFKDQTTALIAECANLKKLAKELGQADLLLQKMEKTLRNIRQDNIRSIVPLLFLAPDENSLPSRPEAASNHLRFYVTSKDGFYASIYSNEPKKVDCIFTPKGTCVSKQKKLAQYTGPVQPVAKIKFHEKDLQDVFKDIPVINPTKPCDSNQLIDAAANGEIDIVLRYIEKNRSILTTDEKVGKYLSIAFQWAASNGDYTMTMLLMTTPGVNINYMGNGDTALMYAANHGYLDIAEALIAKGAALNSTNDSGSTALCLAAISGHYKVVKALVAAGADVNHCNKEGKNALLIAATFGHTEVVVELLKSQNLDPNIKGKDGLNAWKIARQNNYPEIFQLLSDGLALTPANPIKLRVI